MKEITLSNGLKIKDGTITKVWISYQTETGRSTSIPCDSVTFKPDRELCNKDNLKDLAIADKYQTAFGSPTKQI